jgi:hypothetical protein
MSLADEPRPHHSWSADELVGAGERYLRGLPVDYARSQLAPGAGEPGGQREDLALKRMCYYHRQRCKGRVDRGGDASRAGSLPAEVPAEIPREQLSKLVGLPVIDAVAGAQAQ